MPVPLMPLPPAGKKPLTCIVGAESPRSDSDPLALRSPGWLFAAEPSGCSENVPAPAEKFWIISSTVVSPTSFMKVSLKTSAETGMVFSSVEKAVSEFELRAP